MPREARAARIRAVASLKSRFDWIARSISDDRTGSSNVVHHWATSGGAVDTVLSCVVGVATSAGTQPTGISRFGLLKVRTDRAAADDTVRFHANDQK